MQGTADRELDPPAQGRGRRPLRPILSGWTAEEHTPELIFCIFILFLNS